MSGTILWDVDTQVDFVEPGAKLYFPGAEDARPAMARLVEAARGAGIVHVASCDHPCRPRSCAACSTAAARS